MLSIALMVMSTFTAFASNGNGYPQENIKLTGKFYAYPIGLDGSPYLNEEWQMGNLNLENGKTAYNIKVRFNIISSDLIFYNETLKRVFVVDKETIKSFVLNPGSKDSLLFIKYDGTDVGFKLHKSDFLHVLCQGKINFMVKHAADVIDATESNSKNKIYPKDYYFVNFNNQTSEIKIKNRSVYSLFPSKKKEIKRLISENKLRRSSEANLIKLFNLIEKSEGFFDSVEK